jgi:hypothetical protein
MPEVAPTTTYLHTRACAKLLENRYSRHRGTWRTASLSSK